MTWEHSSHSAMCEEPSETRLCWQNASYLKKKNVFIEKFWKELYNSILGRVFFTLIF